MFVVRSLVVTQSIIIYAYAYCCHPNGPHMVKPYVVQTRGEKKKHWPAPGSSLLVVFVYMAGDAENQHCHLQALGLGYPRIKD
jgi:hypothetical protein